PWPLGHLGQQRRRHGQDDRCRIVTGFAANVDLVAVPLAEGQLDGRLVALHLRLGIRILLLLLLFLLFTGLFLVLVFLLVLLFFFLNAVLPERYYGGWLFPAPRLVVRPLVGGVLCLPFCGLGLGEVPDGRVFWRC